LKRALEEQPRVKQPLGQVLFRLKYVTDDTLRRALGRQLNVPYIDLEKMAVDRGLARIITRSFAQRRLIVPISRLGQRLTVAMDDPTATAVIEELRRLTSYEIAVVTSSREAIQRAFARLYDDGREEPDAPAPASHAATGGAAVPGRADDLFNQILMRALESDCSDIHLEMLLTGLHIRFRIDGVLRQPRFSDLQAQLTASAREIVSRIKILAKMDIAERRRPQDGSFRVTVERKKQQVHIDLRVSIIPSYSGESVVIRILDRTKAPRSLDELDLSPVVRSRLNALLEHTTGIFLVTGPTGSGKSTTLYACLNRLQKPEVRILTAEDPVEFVYEDMSQTEVNEAIGNTFATFLRAFLRHDPEVIMVGEIRDRETAEMAFRAAQTGHLLLSTMHTNSAIAALPRLLDLQIEPALIGSSLIGVLSQRLARKICAACRQPDTPPADLVSLFFETVPADLILYKGAGCQACGQSGYKGRMMLADLWVPDEQDLMLVTRGAVLSDVRASAERTTVSMAQDAHVRLRAGQTTLEELLRVLPHSAVTEHRARFSA
jgi:type IV pilus assembly protein PilB